MKFRHLTIVGLTVLILFVWTGTAHADRQQLVPGTPLTLSGTSGGTNDSGDCGYIAPEPNHQIELIEDSPYLQIMLQTAGEPTLLVEGPAGRYCVLPDASGGTVQFSGYAPQGNYEIYIGDRQQGQHSYTLSIFDRSSE